MSSTHPFAGTSVPAEGVSVWLARFLSLQRDDQLSLMLEQFAAESAAHVALWVWSESFAPACGVVGTAQDFCRRHLMWQGNAPDSRLLASTSFPDVAASAVEVVVIEYGALCWVRGDRADLSQDELAWFTTLTQWMANSERQFRDAKLRSLAEFAAGAGHEINNPLGTILGRSQLLLRQEADPERQRWLAAIGGQALRIRDMISDTMVFARPPVPKCRLVEVRPLVGAVVDRFAADLNDAGIELKILEGDQNSPSPLAVELDPEQFQVVIIELVRNAIHAARQRVLNQNRRLGLRFRGRTWRQQDWLEFDVFNNGPELTAAEREHAFDPFFSGRDAGRGLGFGLTKCWRILTSHGGWIGIHSDSEGTTFRTLWPIIEADSSTQN